MGGLWPMNKRGFTLIELLVVIAIIAILVAFSATNYVGVRSRAKDIKKKTELSQLKNALRLYYNDYGVYPGPSASTAVNNLNGCGTAGTSPCLTTCSGQFAAGGSPPGCNAIYMKLLPSSTDYAWSYRQRTSGDDFCLWTTLENTSDAQIAKSQTKCSSVCSTIVPSGSYVVCAD